MTKLDRCWALAQELIVSLNTICVLAHYGLVVDDGECCSFMNGMSYQEALKQVRILRMMVKAPEERHGGRRLPVDGLYMRPCGAQPEFGPEVHGDAIA